MAQNINPPAREIPLTSWGGLVTLFNPVVLPSGASPDCADLSFLPGGFSSRPALERVFATPWGSANTLYAKSYVDNSGIIRNLYLDTAGNFWLENFTASPGTYTLLAKTIAGNTAKSSTAFGREYIAISDGLHGADVPLQYDGTYLDRVTQCGPGLSPTIANLILPSQTLTAIARASNVVTISTSAAHGLIPGNLVQIQGMNPQVFGSITSITIVNEESPGIATVVYTGGVAPPPAGTLVTITNVASTVVGGSITQASRQGQVVTISTSAAHNLSAGAFVTIDLLANTTFNASFTVQQVINENAFTYIQADVDAIDTSGTGVVRLNWPFPNTSEPQQFEVQAVLGATSFQIALNYSDGTWGGGNVSFVWDGTFFVATVPSTTSLTYPQNGPDLTQSPTSGSVANPSGQAAPGQHQMQVMFLTRQGYVTKGSPPVQFIANGGSYLQVSGIPIGPPNIVARILAFTGSLGAYFFYIPATPQVNGVIVGTSTQINDNTTTSVVLDFSDNTLFSALGVSIEGNNLAQQIVLDGALGFGQYASRLITYGQRQCVQNFLNLGFEGGQLAANTPNTLPLGWTLTGAGGGLLADDHFGVVWSVTVGGSGVYGGITQSAYEDAYGDPIIFPNTLYDFRVWIKPTTSDALLTVNASLTSASTSFSATASMSGAVSTGGQYVQGVFSQKTPLNIPSDLILTVWLSTTGASQVVEIDELNIIFDDVPYYTGLNASYVNNPEGFDEETGEFGPEDDTHQVMDLSIIRANLYFLTLDPSGRLHETSQGVTEPVDWTVNEVAANCGAVSTFCMTRSQADNASASGGEEWFAWYSATGIRIFGGESPDKISQEIQRPKGQTFPGAPADLGAFNSAAALTTWGLNDPEQKIMWFGIPTGSSAIPSIIYAVSYLGMDSAEAIASASPVHKSLSGKLVAPDLVRKWSPWRVPLNGGALMYRSAGDLTPVFFSGGSTDYGNVYTLNPQKFTDDDYGLIQPYYTTYACPDRDEEQSLQLGAHMKMVAYTHTYISGLGNLTITIFGDNLLNPWPIVGDYPLQTVPNSDLEWAGGNAQAQRFFFQFSVAAATGTDNWFSMSTFAPSITTLARMPVRGSYP